MPILPITSCAGVILAGGKSSRFGSNKALASLAGRPMIQHIADIMARHFSELRIITNEPASYSFLAWPMSADIFQGIGPLAGIHAALTTCAAEEIFLVGCDMPFLQPALIQYLCSGPNATIVAPCTGQGIEPLFARYHKNILPALEEALNQGQRRPQRFIGQQRPRLLSEEELRRYDPELNSFQNINHRHDLPVNKHGLTKLASHNKA